MCLALHLSQPGQVLTTTPIGEIQLGDNVPGVNPAEAPDRRFGDRVEPEDWRAVRLTAFIDDGSVIQMQLLRPAAWLEERQVEQDGVLAVRLDELSFRGMIRRRFHSGQLAFRHAARRTFPAAGPTTSV